MSEEDELDPRVQIELERLNAASDEINRLENKLEEANNLFRSTLSDCSTSLKLLARRLGSAVQKARPYYEARQSAKRTQLECQTAAVQFQRSSVLHQNARETIQLAEQRFLLNAPSRHSRLHDDADTAHRCHDNQTTATDVTDGASPSSTPPHQLFEFDNAWQEMLNHATMKLLEAEQLKISSERRHQMRAQAFADCQANLRHLERTLERSIRRSRAYFDQRQAVQEELLRQKDCVMRLQSNVSAAKSRYACSLRQLEHISEDIHKQRRLRELTPSSCDVNHAAAVTLADASDLLSDVTGSATSDYAEDFRLSQEQQYWSDMREQIEAISSGIHTSKFQRSNLDEIRYHQITGNSDDAYQVSGNTDDVHQSSDNTDDVDQSSGNTDYVHQSSGNTDDVDQSSGNADDIRQSSGNTDDIHQSSGNDVHLSPGNTDDVDNVQQLTGSSDNIRQLALNSDNIRQLALNSDNVQQLALNSDNVQQLASNSDNVQQLAGNSDNVQLAGNSDNVEQLAGNTDNVQQLASNSDNVQQLALNSDNVQQLAGNSDNVEQLAGNIDNVQQLSGSTDDIQQLTGSTGNIQQLTGSTGNIQQLTGSTDNVQRLTGNVDTPGASGDVSSLKIISDDMFSVASDDKTLVVISSEGSGPSPDTLQR